jgi:hypothetical protein
MIDQIIERYIQLRDLKDQKEALHKADVAKIKDAMEKCENAILGHLNKTGVDSVGSKAGTAFKTTKTSATVKDWDASLNYIKDNDAWNMLDRRDNKTAVAEYMEEHGDVPPGVEWRAETAVQVRRVS